MLQIQVLGYKYNLKNVLKGSVARCLGEVFDFYFWYECWILVVFWYCLSVLCSLSLSWQQSYGCAAAPGVGTLTHLLIIRNHSPETTSHIEDWAWLPVPAGSLSHLLYVSRYSSLPVPVFEKPDFVNLLVFTCLPALHVALLIHSVLCLREQSFTHLLSSLRHLTISLWNPSACWALPVPFFCHPQPLHIP